MTIMTLKTPIYLDNNATTPVDPRVLFAMMPYFSEKFGNAASIHHPFGWEAKDAVDKARGQVAAILGADTKEIVFTSGATESDNIALKGTMEANASKGNHLITCVTEHKAILDTAKYLESKGTQVTYLPVDRQGNIDLAVLEGSITPQTVMISLMMANNEVGTMHPVREIGAIAEKKGVIFHCDATQAVGKVPIDVREMGIHLLSMSGHKLYGPKGVGVLYVREKNPRVKVAPLIHGGGHERGMRSGTLNVTGIVGIGEACEFAMKEMPTEAPRLAELRDRLEKAILAKVDYVHVNGNPNFRIPNTTNISFEFVEGEGMMLRMRDVGVSSGSACTSARLEGSYVLRAMGLPDELIHTSLRFSLGRFTTEEEIDYSIGRILSAVNGLREMSPLYEMAQKGIDISKIQWQGDHHHD
jgi:cysteine desulfurase